MGVGKLTLLRPGCVDDAAPPAPDRSSREGKGCDDETFPLLVLARFGSAAARVSKKACLEMLLAAFCQPARSSFN